MKITPYILLFTSLLMSCKGGHHESNISKVIKHTTPIEYTVSSEDFILEDSLILAKVPDHTIYLKDRKTEITSFQCSKCHSESLESISSKQGGKKNSHWDIKLNHSDIMACSSCHDTQGDLNHLKDINGTPIDFDHSYQLCSQCHTTQFEDWKGGAHGKRLSSWAPPRVSYTCVECHNPHSPEFKQRMPSRHLNVSNEDQTLNEKH
ncbi:MAG: multiheme c-type cytochrome [Flavobacteriales bacterium]